MKRNPSIELYRCLLMLGIVALHTLQCAGYGFSPVARWVEFCVDGFVFISGWYGIKFGWWKIVKLYCLAFWCSAAYMLFCWACGIGGSFGVGNIVHRTFGYWFVNAYVVLMCFAPIVNAAAESQKSRKLFVPLLSVVFGWSFACKVPAFATWVPSASGFGSHTFLTLLGVYVVARIARLDHWDEKFTTKQLLICLVVLSLLAVCNLNKYNSPVAVLLGGALFVLFERLKLQQDAFTSKAILFMVPSMLAVYLLHASGADFVILRFLLGHMAFATWMSCAVTIFVVFFACVLVDLLRRVVLAIAAGAVERGWQSGEK